jgi:hypothetical protein
VTAPARTVSRADIEAKLAEIRGDVDSTKKQVLDKAKIAGVAAGVILAVVLYLMGQRSGKQHRTIVEVRRV